jgi:imidazolonepropionase-like amidohydrolase
LDDEKLKIWAGEWRMNGACRIKSVLAAAAATLLCMQQAAAETVVVSSKHMVDVLSGRIVDDPVIVVTDGRITAVASKGSASSIVPEGAKIIDLGDMTVLPGLIDMHVHLTEDPRYSSGYRHYEFTDRFWTVVGVRASSDMLEAGFTTVRNLGSAGYDDVALKQAIDAGIVPGPRIVPAANFVGVTGGHCDNNMLPPSIHVTGPGIANSPDEFRQRVREQHKYGAEVIKVCATGGVLSRNTDPGAQQMTEDELRAVAEEAHMLGMRVAAHAEGTKGIDASIRAGIDTIEHANMIDDEGIRLAKQRGIWLSMDLYNSDYIQAEGAKNGVLAESLRKDREIAAIQRANLGKANRAGVKMVFGSDAGVMPHGTAARQFAMMVHFGMSPMAAIQSATRNAAEALGRERDVGAIEAGRYGDLIAVRGNPIGDIRLLENVSFVMKGGEVVKDARQ